MAHAPRFDPDELLQHESFVRELAGLLVYAGQAADDVVQDTWVAALQAPARPLHSLRAWLATIVRRTAGRHARSARRRRQREQRAGHDEPEPVADFAEREQARAAIVRAVLALPSGYRDVVLLRWFEGLPPREVARRLELPVETVRTRNRRALEQLRTALDEHSDGDRAAWTALLLPLVDAGRPALPSANVATATLLGGTLLMSTKLQLTVAAAVALALAGWALFAPAPPPLPSAKADDASRIGVASSELPAAVDGRIATTDSLREVVATPPATAPMATTGSAVVSVLWSDRTPAQGVLVMLRGGDVRRTIVCDAAGIARFDDLPPALYLTNIERGSYRDVEQPRMKVEAGAEATAEIVVAEALDITGVVVDGVGRPIAAAEIVVSSGGVSNVVVGRTGADGRFTARDIGVDGYVGARAAGLAPSMLRRMTGSVGGSAELRFVLDQPAAAVTGTVFGPDGKAVPGARVLVGSGNGFSVRLADGFSGEAPDVEIRDTDASGQFSCAPLQAGAQRLRVEAHGLAPWWQDVTLTAGSTTNLMVHLQVGVTIRGVVRTADGRAMPKCWISAPGPGDNGAVESTADGSYELADVSPGKITLRLRMPDEAMIEHTVQAVAGQLVRWDPVLNGTTERREQCGRVVDHEGRAVRGADVSASLLADGSGYWRAQARTDAEGRFRLTNCEAGVPFYVSVSTGGPIADAKLAVVRPDDEELLVTLPAPTKVRVRGTVLDDRGAPLPNVEMYVMHRDRGTLRDSNRPDGTFDFGPFPAGEYKLLLLSNGFARLWLPFRMLADGETWDAGELRMQRGGNVRATFVGAPLSDRFVDVRFPDGSYADAAQTENAHVVLGPLAAGDYLLQLTGDDVVCQCMPIRIRDGIDTTLEVPVVVGTPATFAFTWPASARPPLGVHVTIADGAATRLQQPVWNRDGTMQLRTMLEPGRYRIEVQAETGLSPKLGRTVEIDVGAAAALHTIELRPQD